jgi:hypothetical protein
MEKAEKKKSTKQEELRVGMSVYWLRIDDSIASEGAWKMLASYDFDGHTYEVFADSIVEARRKAYYSLRRLEAARGHQVRCGDCGALGERTGHMECQYPQDH